MSNGSTDTYWSSLDVVPDGEAVDSLLVRQFREFYAELVRLKREVERDTYVSTDPDAENGGAAALQQRFVSMFNDHEQAVRRQGGESLRNRYRLAQYAMVALADEVFLNFDWGGRDYWYGHLLESRQFDSRSAGTQVFEIIDRLLQQRSTKADVATVYLYALTLGFEGQYRDASDRSALTGYRERLHQHIKRREAQQLDEDRPLSASAYRHTLDRGEMQLLPSLRWWTGGLVAVSVLYLGGSTAVWWWYTDTLAELAQQILTIP
jgi:type VI secretion system protein ImpK